MMNKPMTEQAFFVLTTLIDEPLHGYAIMQAMTDLSDGRVNVRVGTLYGVLDRLSAEGLIELDREEIVQGRARKYYRLSDEGSIALARDAARQSANAAAAQRRLAPRFSRMLGDPA